MMKNLFLFLLAAPLTVSAQNVEISAMGGLTYNSFTMDQSSYVNKSNVGATGSVQLAVERNSLSFGVKADMYSLKTTCEILTYGLNSNSEYMVNILYNTYNPALNFSLFANKHFTLERNTIYAGVQIGYVFSTGSKTQYGDHPEDAFLMPLDYNSGKSNGLTFGIQVGYALKVTENLGVKAEFSPRYLYSLKANGQKDDNHFYNAIVVPITAGISYTF